MATVTILENAGINSYSKNDSIQNIISSGIETAPIRIQVASNNAEVAINILDGQIFKGEDVSEYSVPDICPACKNYTKGLPHCLNCGLVLAPKIYNVEEEDIESLIKKIRLSLKIRLVDKFMSTLEEIIETFFRNKTR